MIYFARFPSGSIKIGHTIDKINIRMSNLRSYYGVDLVLLKTMEGDIHTEAELHARFAHLRMHVHAEQFRPAPDLLEYIGVSDPESYDAAAATVQSAETVILNRAHRPPAKKFTTHQITLDAETLRIAESLIDNLPEIYGLSAAIRHIIRFYDSHAQRTGKDSL